MTSSRLPLFRKRWFEPAVIVTCVRWYLRFCLSLRDVEELMAERGLSVDHTTIWRWVQKYSPEVTERLKGEVKRSLRRGTWMKRLCERPDVGCTCSVLSTGRARRWTSIV